MTLSTQTSAPPLARPYAWNLVSLDYTRDFAPHCAEYAVDALDLVRVPAGARVLDVATGPGTLAFVAARRGLSVTAVDFSADMIALLRGRAAAEGMDHRILAREGDGEALPFAESTFDAAFSLFGLMFFADRARGLSELHRVLVPGGRAVIGSWAPLESVPAIGALFAALRRAAPELGVPPAPAPLGEAQEVESSLRAAGFREVAVHTVEHALVFESAASFWSSFARSAAPIALLRERTGEARWSAIAEAVVAELESELPERPVALRMPAHLGFGIR